MMERAWKRAVASGSSGHLSGCCVFVEGGGGISKTCHSGLSAKREIDRLNVFGCFKNENIGAHPAPAKGRGHGEQWSKGTI